MQENHEKIVEFEKWCGRCKYKELLGTDEPCNECLSYPVRMNSTKPEKWESKE